MEGKPKKTVFSLIDFQIESKSRWETIKIRFEKNTKYEGNIDKQKCIIEHV